MPLTTLFRCGDVMTGRGIDQILGLDVVPTRIRRFRVRRAGDRDAKWLAAVLDRESRPLGTRARLRADGRIGIGWRG